MTEHESHPGPWGAVLAHLVRESHLARPDALVELVNDALRPLGVDATAYLVDHEQRTLRPVPERGKPAADPVPIRATPAGRAFTGLEVIPTGGTLERLWLPLVDGTDRLGVVEATLAEGRSADDPAIRSGLLLVAGLLAHLITSKAAYCDPMLQVRRSQPMTASAELLWHLLPPLCVATPGLVVAGLLEPCYEVGGDAFDYAVHGSSLWLGILDGVGHGMPAAVTTAVGLSAMRAARRDGHGLSAVGRAADAALLSEFDDQRFITGVLALLDTDTGALRYLNAGHPRPILVRRGRVIRHLAAGRRLPFGLDDPAVDIGTEQLEPGDLLLLYSDGITEARAADGTLFGLDRLVALAEREAAARLPAAETVRRLGHAVLAHQDGPPRDDATLVLLEWSPAAARRAAP